MAQPLKRHLISKQQKNIQILKFNNKILRIALENARFEV
jgi:hypothetical protein